jgi:hypothetical protein
MKMVLNKERVMAIHKGENRYIYGFHDPGGEHLMIVNGEAKGWSLLWSPKPLAQKLMTGVGGTTGTSATKR